MYHGNLNVSSIDGFSKPPLLILWSFRTTTILSDSYNYTGIYVRYFIQWVSEVVVIILVFTVHLYKGELVYHLFQLVIVEFLGQGLGDSNYPPRPHTDF